MKIIQKQKCLLCKSIAELRHNNYTGYQEPLKFEIYCCTSCNTSFSLPRVETTAIYENIYKCGEKVPGYDRYWRYAKKIKYNKSPLEYLAKSEAIYWGVKEALSLYVKDKTTTSIIELGSGLGYLTYSLIKENYNVLGLDISETAVKNATENFGEYYKCANVYEYSKNNANSFDIIILTEVIEHIDNPLNFMKTVTKLLKSDGIAIITTPNKSLFPSNVVWASDLPPVHCWWLSEDSIMYIANEINTSVNLIKFDRYYKENYRSYNLKVLLKDHLPQPIFDKNGKLIFKDNIITSNFRLLIGKIPYFKKIYKKIYQKINEKFNKNLIVCGTRGSMLCAVLQKKI